MVAYQDGHSQFRQRSSDMTSKVSISEEVARQGAQDLAQFGVIPPLFSRGSGQEIRLPLDRETKSM